MSTSSIFSLAGLLVLSLEICVAASLSAQDRLPATNDPSLHGINVEREYQKWLNEDVRYIISDEERTKFKKLATVQQRDEFVVEFWGSRNPNPGSSRNLYKEEHYRRLAYSNTHFAAGSAGYTTDRGRFYITYGPPDSVVSSPGFSPPAETWSYQLVEGLGRHVTVTFTDECRCGKYSLSKMDSDSPRPGILEPF